MGEGTEQFGTGIEVVEGKQGTAFQLGDQGRGGFGIEHDPQGVVAGHEEGQGLVNQDHEQANDDGGQGGAVPEGVDDILGG